MPPADPSSVVGGLYALEAGDARPTPYGARRPGTRLTDGVPVEVELLSPALAGDPAVRTRLVQGGDALRALNGRHVVRTLHVLVEERVVAVVRDRFDAAVLADARRAEGGTVSPRQAVVTVVEVLDGLAEVHAAGLVHGGLSERDVLMDTSVPLRTVVRVTGYGVAALLGRPDDLPLAPGAGAVPQAADDVWAAGALLGLLLLGAAATPGLLQASALPAPLLAAVLPLLADDPAARPGAAQARDALAALLATPLLDALPPLVPLVRPEPAPAPSPVQPTVLAQPGPEPRPEPEPEPVPAPLVLPAPPTLEPPVVLPEPEPQPVAAAGGPVVLPPAGPREPAPPARRRAAVLATVAVVAVLALVGAVLAGLRLSSPEPAAQPAPSPLARPEPLAPLALPLIERPDGLTVARTWSVTPDGARLRGVSIVQNTTARPVMAKVDEVVPKSVADDVAELTFTPAYARVVQRDPVVQYDVDRLPPGRSYSWQFDALLDVPVTTAEALAALVDDAEQARAEHETAAAPPARPTLLRLAVAPVSLQLRVGETRRLAITGRTSDGRVVPGSRIGGIVVTSSDLRVLQAQGGVVRGRAPGRAVLRVQAGTVRTAATVVVLAPPPPVVVPPAPQPSATPRPTPSARPATAAPRPTTAAPRPRPTTARPRPATPRPRPTTAAPRPAPTRTATPRPAPSRTASPRPAPTRTASPRPASPRPSATSPRPRPTF